MGALNRDTLELIQKTAQEAEAVLTQPMPNNPEKLLVLAKGGATVLDTPFVAGPRKHVIESIESFAAAYNRWGTSEVDATMANIWLDLEHWSLLFFEDEPLRRSSIKLMLKPSPQLLLLRTFANQQSLEQKKLVRILRHDLAECVDPGVLAAFRTVDFQKITTARAAIQHEKQSLDADIVAQVTGEKKPDAFVVDAPLFAMKEMADARTRVGITIDIDCDERKFVLQAKPGHLEIAIDDARAAVLTKLENDLAALSHADVTILAGCPNN